MHVTNDGSVKKSYHMEFANCKADGEMDVQINLGALNEDEDNAIL